MTDSPDDFIAAGRKPWKPFVVGDEPEISTSAPPDKLVPYTPFVLVDPAAIPRRQWLYNHHLIRGHVAAKAAVGSLGKTTLVCGEALAIATGKPLLGKLVGEAQRVWIYNLEDDRDELNRRLVAACQFHGITAGDIGDRLALDIGRERELVIAHALRGNVTVNVPVVNALVEAMIEHTVDVLIIDPFVDCHMVPENDNAAINEVVKEWAKVASKANAAIELVHHTRKGNGEETTINSTRGAISFVNKARSVQVMNRMTDKEAEKLGVMEDERWQYFRVDNGKANMMPPGKAVWYRLHDVELANGDQVGVATGWTPPDAFHGVTANDLLRIQQAIDGKGYRWSSQANDWVGKVVADVLRLDAEKSKNKIIAILNVWKDNDLITVTEIRDARGNKRPVVEVGKWAT